MSTSKFLRIKVIACLLLGFGTASSLAQCKKIDAEAKVVQSTNEKPSIIIDYKGSNGDNFKVSLFGPDRKNELNVQKKTFDDLIKGKYIIVIVGKKEEDNYCPKSINVTIN